MNYAEQYDEIVSASERAIAQLQEISKAKLELLLGVEVELRREREEIEWVEAFMAEKSRAAAELCGNGKDRCDYLNFLNAWKSHAVLRNGLSRAVPQEVDILEDIEPDMVVHADIVVGTTHQSSALPLSSRQQRRSSRANQPDMNDDNLSNSTSVFNDCLQDAKHFYDAVATSSGLYSVHPAKPLDSLISSDTQALVDRNRTKIDLAMKAALENTPERVMPLPDSITRPSVSGSQYPLPDNSPFQSAYNEMGNNENFTELQLQAEIEKNIQEYAKNDLTPPPPHVVDDDSGNNSMYHVPAPVPKQPLTQVN